MALGNDDIEKAMLSLAALHPAFEQAHALHGTPEPREAPRGYEALLRAIVAQQVSTAAARSIWARLDEAVAGAGDPERLLATDPDALRAAGLSRPKIGYARSLAEHIIDGSLPIHDLPEDDEEAIALISAVKGLGRWSAEIYLLFAEGRRDIFPAGDLAVRIQAGRMFHGGERPTEKQLRQLSEAWRPHRGTAALFFWHCYNIRPI